MSKVDLVKLVVYQCNRKEVISEENYKKIIELILQEPEDLFVDEVAEKLTLKKIRQKLLESFKFLEPKEALVLSLKFGICSKRSFNVFEIVDLFKSTRQKIEDIIYSALEKLRSLYCCPWCQSKSYYHNGDPWKDDTLTCKTCGKVFTERHGMRAGLGLSYNDFGN